MKLREIAHSRTGDKGNTSIISVIAYDMANYEYIKENLTESVVAEYFKDITFGEVTRYEFPNLGALNFVMRDALGGGVTRSLALDAHGKALGFALLEIDI